MVEIDRDLEKLNSIAGSYYRSPQVPLPEDATVTPLKPSTENIGPRVSSISETNLDLEKLNTIASAYQVKPTGIPKPTPTPEPTTLTGEIGKGLKGGLYDIKGMVGGAVEMAGTIAKSEGMKTYGKEMAEAAKVSSEPYIPAIGRVEDISNVKDFGLFASHTLARLVPNVAAVVGTTLAAATAATALGAPAAVATGVAGMAGFLSSLVMETGQITELQKQEGMRELDPVKALWAIPSAALDVLPQLHLVKRIGLLDKVLGASHVKEGIGGAAGFFSKNVFGRVAKQLGIQATEEAVTEGPQAILERFGAGNYRMDKEALSDFLNSFVAGGLMGAFMGGLGGSFSKAPPIVKRAGTLPPSTTEIPGVTQGIPEPKLPSEQLTGFPGAETFGEEVKPLTLEERIRRGDRDYDKMSDMDVLSFFGFGEDQTVNDIIKQTENIAQRTKLIPIDRRQGILGLLLPNGMTITFDVGLETGKPNPISVIDEKGTERKIDVIGDTEFEKLGQQLLGLVVKEKPSIQGGRKIFVEHVTTIDKNIPVNIAQEILKKPGVAVIPEKSPPLGPLSAVPGVPPTAEGFGRIAEPSVLKELENQYSELERKIAPLQTRENLLKTNVLQSTYARSRTIHNELYNLKNERDELYTKIQELRKQQAPTPEGHGRIVEPLTRYVTHTKEEAPTVSPSTHGTNAGTEGVFKKEYANEFGPGGFADRSYWYAPGQRVEPRFQGRMITRSMGLIIFDVKTATPEQLDAFNKKRDELTQKFRNKFGEDFGNLPQQAQEVDYAAARDLGYDGLNQGDHVGVFKEVARNIEGFGRIAEGWKPRYVITGENVLRDGHVVGKFKTRDEAIAYVREQKELDKIKTFDEYGNEIKEGFGRAAPRETPYFSKLLNVIKQKVKGSIPAGQLPPMLKGAGVSPQEIYWTGLEDYLKEKSGKITMEELLDYVKANQVEVKEIIKSDKGELSETEWTGTKFSQWQLPGGENYRELLLTLPEKESHLQMIDSQTGKLLERGKEPYISSHWEEPNVLAHIRFNDRVDAQGKKVLFIEEVQSDWHQAGREKGYLTEKLSSEERAWFDQTSKKIARKERLTSDEENRYYRLQGIDLGTKEGIPPAPFSKTWHEMAMRRMVRWASENGYDKVAWTTGEQQAARYDLSKQVREVSVQKTDIGGYAIRYQDNNGRIHDVEGSIQPEKLPEYVGKDLANKIIQDVTEKYATKVYSGLDLKVGGEGMKGFYDKIIPEYMNKFGKKWGAKVGDIEIPTETPYKVKEISQLIPGQPEKVYEVYNIRTGAERTQFPSYQEALKYADMQSRGKEGVTVHSLDITPPMKQSVMEEGVQLFRKETPKPGSPLRGNMTHEVVVGLAQNLSTRISPLIANFYAARNQDELRTIVEKHGGEQLDPNKIYYGYTLIPEKGGGPATVVFVSDQIKTPILFERTGWHELSGHIGIEMMFDSRPEFNVFMDKVYGYFTIKDPAGLSRTASVYRADINTMEGRRLAAKELFAFFSEKNPHQGIVKEFIALVRRLLRTMGFTNMTLSDTEVISAMMRSRALVTSSTTSIASPITFRAYTKGETIYSIVESNEYDGAKLTLQQNQTQLVMRDLPGNDIGRLLITKTNTGIDIDRINVNKEFKRKGIAASAIFSAVNKYGPIQNILEPTKEGRDVINAVTMEHPEFYRDNSVRMADARTSEGRVTEGFGMIDIFTYEVLMDKKRKAALIKDEPLRKRTQSEIEARMAMHQRRAEMAREEPKKERGFFDKLGNWVKGEGFGMIDITDPFTHIVLMEEKKKAALIKDEPLRKKTEAEIEARIAMHQRRAEMAKEEGFGKVAPGVNVPEINGLIYNGVQKIPGEPDQYVFTDVKTKSTFYSKSLDPKFLENERDRVRKKYEGFGKLVMPEDENSFPGATPDDTSEVKNMTGWQLWKAAREGRDKNFANEIKKDMGIYEYIWQLPHWVSMKFKEFAGITNVEWERLDRMNADRVKLMMEGDTNLDNAFLATKDVKGLEPLIVYSDAEDIYMDDNNVLQNKARELIGRELSAEEVNAYHSWKAAFDKGKVYIIEKAKNILNLRMMTAGQMGLLAKSVADGNTRIEEAVFNNDKEQKTFNTLLTDYQQNIQKIEDLKTKLDGINFYMPRIRENGDYVVRVYSTDEKGIERAIFADRRESDIQAEKLRLQLLSDPTYKDLKILKTKENIAPEFIFEGINQSKIEAFLERSVERAQRKEGLTSEEAQVILDNIYNTVENEILARGFRETYLRRVRLPGGTPIAGYKTEDLKSVFINYMSGLAGSMNKLEATFKFHEAMKEIDKVKQPNLFEYGHRYIADMLRNSDNVTRMVNRAKSIPYAWYLMANVRMVAAQLFQNYITGASILSSYRAEQKVGAGATRRISKAMFDVATGNTTDEEKRVLNKAYLEGETTANMINEMKGRVEGGWASKAQGVIDVLSIPFSGMEKLNRQTAILAAYRLGREQGLIGSESYDRAKQFVRDAHYAYGKSNMPQLLRDGTTFAQVAGGAYTFRSFTHNYILSMMHYARTADGKLAIGVVGRSLAFTILLGGLAAAPFLDDILDGLERLTGENYRSQIRKSLKGIGGEILSTIGMSGIPTILGMDLSGTVKITPPIPFVGQGTSNTVWGVWGGLADKGSKAIHSAINGDWARAIEPAAPTGLESPLKALRGATEGVRGPTNKPIVDEMGRPVVLTTGEAITQSLAMRPARVAALSSERRVEANVETYFTEKRKDIYSNVRVAKTPDDWAKVIKQVQTFNVKAMGYRGAISPITMDSIRNSMKTSMKYPKYAATLREEE